MSNKDILKNIKSEKSRYYIFDFHVHSPASFDVRLGQRFNNLEEGIKEKIKVIDENLTKNHEEYEKKVIETLNPESYYELLVEHKNNILEKEDVELGEDWAFIAITDHNICKYAEELSDISLKSDKMKKNRLIILPGIELEVEFLEPTSRERESIHILLIFKPGTKQYDICSAINIATGNQTWIYGEKLQIDNLEEFISKIRKGEKSAIAIAAHIGSSKGIEKETKKSILNSKDIEILRIDNEIYNEKNDTKKKELSNEKAKLEKEKEPNEISCVVLELIGKCGFDALQIRDKDDEKFYRNINRHTEELGRSVAIACSDSHTIINIFDCKGKDDNHVIPYIKLNNLSEMIKHKEFSDELFKEIKEQGLRFGETRVIFRRPGKVNYWIDGIEISKGMENSSEFWINDNTAQSQHDGKLYIPLSRNLNCLIGGRGSGKSAVIEILEFIQHHNEFQSIGNKKSIDWYERAKATLKGYNISLIWKMEKGSIIKKSKLFIKGFFDEEAKYDKFTYTDCDDKDVAIGTIELPKADIYRIHDIEEKAKPDKLRILFDNICGEKVNILSDEISKLKKELIENRKKIINIANDINILTKENSPLREYSKRKRDFELVNTKKIEKQFEELDEVSQIKSEIEKLINNWGKLIKKSNLSEMENDIKEFVNYLPKDINEKIKKIFSDKDQDVINIYENNIKRDITRILNDVEILGLELSWQKDKFLEILMNVHKKENSLNEELRKLGVECNNRTMKRDLYNESQRDLELYKSNLEKMKKLLDIRKEMMQKLSEKNNERSKLRKYTAESITKMLSKNLNQDIIQIEVDAQEQTDKEQLNSWFSGEFEWGNKNRYKEKRIESLLRKDNITPDNLYKEFMNEMDVKELLVTEVDNTAGGKIDMALSEELIKHNKVYQKIKVEDNIAQMSELPDELIQGLYEFGVKEKSGQLILDSVLKLNEIIFDDFPIIRLNDRPMDSFSKKKNLDKLSPGQRCSAILPIILLSDNCPVIIDQPEDNLDNRLIREVIVNILANIKLKRQVIIATHNANLPVLGDAENVIALRGVDENKCSIETIGSIDNKEVIKNITYIMEGGREAFQYRQQIYQTYWNSGAER